MTSYTRARHIAIPEKSLFRLVSRHIVYWRISPPEDENAVFRTEHGLPSVQLSSL
jgi:hypothetical protein